MANYWNYIRGGIRKSKGDGGAMIPEIGLFALILALLVAVLQSVLPIVGAARKNYSWISIARPAAFAQLLFVAISYACLTAAFLSHIC